MPDEHATPMPAPPSGKATRINLLDFRSPQMRAFHMSWFAFFLCFFAWFGIAPLMAAQIKGEFKLTKAQISHLGVAAVSITFFARLFFGWLCDRVGPRLSYSALLVFGSIPVMCVGLAHTYPTFMLLRLLIGVIGASFVITQYHTSSMFAPRIVGTANAMTGGWGNLGGGVTQQVMPAVFAALVAHGISKADSWRLAMLGAGVICLLTGVAYFLLTQDTPQGNVLALRREGRGPARKSVSLFAAANDPRVWLLFVLYGSCFGIELTVDQFLHTYLSDKFGMSIKAAGWAAFSFGGMNLFARALGGFGSDAVNRSGGLNGRTKWLFAILLAEGVSLIVFSRMDALVPTLGALAVFGLFVCMGCGAVYAVVPFVNKDAVGSVSGIVGAGGNAGAVAAGFLFAGADWGHQFLVLGVAVTACSFLALLVRFSTADEVADAPLQPPAHAVGLEPAVA